MFKFSIIAFTFGIILSLMVLSGVMAQTPTTSEVIPTKAPATGRG